MSKSGKGYSIDEKQRAIEKYADGITYSARYSGEFVLEGGAWWDRESLLTLHCRYS
jgi:hypothetical protein